MANLFELVDFTVRRYCETWGVVFAFRCGSSLHPEEFTSSSDVDFIIVVSSIRRDFLRRFPGRAGLFTSETVLHDPFWLRSSIAKSHPVQVVVYSEKTFRRLCRRREPKQMYLLNDHLLLVGDAEEVSRLRERFPPNWRTIHADFLMLRKMWYDRVFRREFLVGYEFPRFLWAWRSVILAREGVFLTSKAPIRRWVAEHYPGKIDDSEALLAVLGGELRWSWFNAVLEKFFKSGHSTVGKVMFG